MTTDAFNLLIGENVRQNRERAGMTQAQLTEKIGIGVPFISRIERGEKSMRLQTLRSIASALDISCDALLEPEITINPHIRTIINLLKEQPPSYIEGIAEVIRTCGKYFSGKDGASINAEKDSIGDDNAS